MNNHMEHLPNARSWIAFGFSVFVGAFVWIASPYVTGKLEPWDSQNFYYSGSLLFGGFIAGFFVPRRFWLWPMGLWVGQVLGFGWRAASTPGSTDPLMPLGFFLFLPLYSLWWGVLGTLVGTGAGLWFRRPSFARVILWLSAGYCAACTATLPFIDAWWLGELPVLALVQSPKLILAQWLRVDIVMPVLRLLGWSHGSFSPDFTTARPYALALAYLLSMGLVLAVTWRWSRWRRQPFPRGTAGLFLAAAALDYAMTLAYGAQRGLTLY